MTYAWTPCLFWLMWFCCKAPVRLAGSLLLVCHDHTVTFQSLTKALATYHGQWLRMKITDGSFSNYFRLPSFRMNTELGKSWTWERLSKRVSVCQVCSHPTRKPSIQSCVFTIIETHFRYTVGYWIGVRKPEREVSESFNHRVLSLQMFRVTQRWRES